MKVAFGRCNLDGLANVPVIDGQILFVKDTGEMYVDQGTARTKISDINFIDTIETRNNIASPSQSKLYFVIENTSIYYYNGSSWVLVGGNAFDNTGTNLTATTIQAAIIELNDKIDGLINKE